MCTQGPIVVEMAILLTYWTFAVAGFFCAALAGVFCCCGLFTCEVVDGVTVWAERNPPAKINTAEKIHTKDETGEESCIDFVFIIGPVPFRWKGI